MIEWRGYSAGLWVSKYSRRRLEDAVERVDVMMVLAFLTLVNGILLYSYNEIPTTHFPTAVFLQKPFPRYTLSYIFIFQHNEFPTLRFAT